MTIQSYTAARLQTGLRPRDVPVARHRPLISDDSERHFCHRGPSEWGDERGWLTDACLDGRDAFAQPPDMLEAEHG